MRLCGRDQRCLWRAPDGRFLCFRADLGHLQSLRPCPCRRGSCVRSARVEGAWGDERVYEPNRPDPRAVPQRHGDSPLARGILRALWNSSHARGELCRGALARMRLPRPLQPVLGGLAVGLLALETPKVLASGHGALAQLFAPGAATPDVIVLTLLLKAAASVISLGTGFRGGLFFASLFLGGMAGQTYYFAIGHLDPILAPDLLVCTIIGMASLAVAVIGTPLTMTFLALETTGNFPLAAIMLAAASIVSIIVRRTFGYSFATWRLHLRGESIRSAQDVGWMRDLTVGRLMRSDVPLAPADITIGEFIEEFPARSTSQWVARTDRYG